ncbi:MAG: FMN-binding negative transcriptional regulator [Chitinophagaceae bacterium]|nr:FMN-binding negative transcriptional regulator [Chitinophagaceae bacterium]
MYNLSYFKEKDQEVVVEFMKQHPFAMLIGSANDRSCATQIPLLFEERENKIFLIGHMMRKQDHQIAFEKNPNVLVVFTGPHTYVSATWYSNPHQASTWNYMSVHARGLIRFLDQRGLEDALKKLTLHYENNNPHSSTVFDNLPQDYTSHLMKSIIAFEIEVQEIENVFKLSQNRDEQSFHHIMDKLSTQDADSQKIAEEMNKRKEQLYHR